MSPETNHSAFAIKFSTAVAVLETEIGISKPYDPDSEGGTPRITSFKAVWDTGASCCVISRKVVDSLKTPQIDSIVTHTANGTRLSGVYLVNVYLPNKVSFSAVRAIDADIDAFSADVLIGMDIIGKGDFAVTHKNKTTCMTFQIPSRRHIDFVKDMEKGKS